MKKQLWLHEFLEAGWSSLTSLAWKDPFQKVWTQLMSILFLEVQCPAKFSFNLPHGQRTCLEGSRNPEDLDYLIQVCSFELDLNSAGM